MSTINLSQEELSKKNLITEILQVCAASDCKGMDKIFLSLAYLDECQLRQVAKELHIKVN